VSLEAAGWSGAEVTLSTTIANQRGQLYWIAPGGQADEQRSVAWDLVADGQPHTYRLSLAGRPGWQGAIGLLRLDPVGAGDGAGLVTLHQLRLTP
jgi:hypothetical protein